MPDGHICDEGERTVLTAMWDVDSQDYYVQFSGPDAEQAEIEWLAKFPPGTYWTESPNHDWLDVTEFGGPTIQRCMSCGLERETVN